MHLAANRRRVTRCAAIVALLLAGAMAPTAAVAAPHVIHGTNGATVPKLDWSQCQEDGTYECAVADVPLSYRDPAGQSIELALAKLPATDQAHKLGTLFYNPGGPGAPARYPFEISPALHKRFDIVGFDPRGIGESTPVKCFSSDDQAMHAFGWSFPTTPDQEQQVIDATKQGTDRCAQQGGKLLSHVSTANVARDLDLLRQAVGDDQLTYIGYSYGSHIGEVYSNLFPGKVRAMTLDGIIDPIEWTSGRNPDDTFTPVEYRLGSFLGAEKALNAFLTACAATTRCSFREEGVDLREKYDTLLQRFKDGPIKFVDSDGSSYYVSYQDVVGFTLGLLYDATQSPVLSDTLQDLYTATESSQEGQRLPAPSEHALRHVGRPRYARPHQGAEPYLGLEWFSMVECSDSSNSADPWTWPRSARAADREAPHFGSIWTYGSLPCATWPANDADRYDGPWNRKTAKPVLLIGNSKGDPATPYEDAQSTAAELGDARLLTLDSFGHTAQGGLSKCIDDAVDKYLIDLALPAKGKVCEPDAGPFDATSEQMARRHATRSAR